MTAIRALLPAAAAAAMTLASATSAPATSGQERQLRASAGAVIAVLSYNAKSEYQLQPTRIRISRHGRTRLNEAVPPRPEYSEAYLDYPAARALAVRDLDADGEPETLLNLNWGGAHCCSWTRLYHYDRASGRYRTTVQFWGDAVAYPTLRDLNGDRTVEFVSRNDDFVGEFTYYANSSAPLRIWTYRQGRFVDSTHSFPTQLRADAAKLAARVSASAPDGRGAGAAWAADEALLGQKAAARTQMNAWAQHGLFNGDPNNYTDLQPVGPEYVTAVWRFLAKHGYLG